MVEGITEQTLEAVYRALYIGMDLYEALLVCEVPDDVIVALDTDADFKRHVNFWKNKAVYDILDEQHATMKRNLSTGTSVEARWLLSKLDRKRFGNGPVEVGGSDELPPLSVSLKTGEGTAKIEAD